MGPDRSVTMADVAARAGVSTTSVSVALNNTPGARLSPDAVSRIKRAAKELGYRPNTAARGLRVGRTHTVGLLSDDVTVTRFASAMIKGVMDVAHAKRHTVLIAETGDWLANVATALDAMLNHQPDGLIVALMGAKEIDLPPIPDDLRLVVLNATSGDRPCVLPDEFAAGHAVAQHLIERGHRRIALIGHSDILATYPRVSATIGTRYAGINAAFAEAGLDPVVRVPGGLWEPNLGYDAAMELFASNLEFTALLCLNDRIAFGAYQAITELGLRIPHDISVASFDDEVIAGYVRPSLTTARLPYEAMGRAAMGLIVGQDDPTGRHLVPMPLIVRGSVAFQNDAEPPFSRSDSPSHPERRRMGGGVHPRRVEEPR